MSPQHIASLIIEYRYWILVPFAIVEGPIVAFISGTLASLGYFNIFVLMVFFFARDMIMDAAWYYLGYFGYRTAFIKRMLAKMNIQESHIKDVHELWDKYPARTMFIGKLSYGIAAAFVAVAGVVKMSLTKFFSYGALVAVVEYGGLLLVGYFFGNAFGGSLTGIVDNIQYAVAGALALLSTFYILRWWIRKRFAKEEVAV
jgi:membrane protein DedA with SNARE-associated domain